MSTKPTTEELEGRATQLRFDFDIKTEDEVALAIGVTPSTLTVWRSKGEGPAYVKLGKAVFYRPSDVQEWISRCRVTPGASQPDEPANDNAPDSVATVGVDYAKDAA
ncbi:helix-turn-helix transcriptional regulator [Pseudolabrys sp.]|uniref:helix-turn-helix transcriptional regulator n=1 Tax=Pseudolabrys sp. TaxID=1960880 RepID=UPI003D12949E